jgi:predicted acyl esterase
VRARYRNGCESPDFLEPDQAYEYRLESNPIGCLFRAGQLLRLYVPSSDFPNSDRNHNTGEDYWADDELRVANQAIFHGPSMPSHLVLPVMPNADGRPGTTQRQKPGHQMTPSGRSRKRAGQEQER